MGVSASDMHRNWACPTVTPFSCRDSVLDRMARVLKGIIRKRVGETRMAPENSSMDVAVMMPNE
jgi:hypothetical protein